MLWARLSILAALFDVLSRKAGRVAGRPTRWRPTVVAPHLFPSVFLQAKKRNPLCVYICTFFFTLTGDRSSQDLRETQKNYISTYFYQQYLVLFTKVPRKRIYLAIGFRSFPLISPPSTHLILLVISATPCESRPIMSGGGTLMDWAAIGSALLVNPRPMVRTPGSFVPGTALLRGPMANTTKSC